MDHRHKKSHDLVLIRIKESRTFRAAADSLYGPLGYTIQANACGILSGSAPGAPELQVAEVEYNGERKTVRIEVTPNDYVVMK